MKTRQSMLLAAVIASAASLTAQNVAYTVDNTSGQIRVVDLGRRSASLAIEVGHDPAGLVIMPSNRTAFVANQADNNVAVLDLRTNARLAIVPTGQAPGDLVASPDGRFLYVANEGSNDVTVIDASQNTVLATVPVGITPVAINISPSGRYVYVVNQDAAPSGTVSVIDSRRNEVIGTLSVGLKPVQFAISPNHLKAFVINSGSANVSVVDLSSNQVTAAIAVGQGPSSAAFSTDGRFLYVINKSSGSVSVIDTTQNRVTATVSVGSQPAAMAVTFDSKFAYVTNQGSGSVTVVDLTTNTAESTIPVGSGPFDLSLDPNEDFIYVTNLTSQSLSVIDTSSDRVVSTIPIGGAPVQFSFLNSPTLFELAPNPALPGSRVILNGEGFVPGSSVQLLLGRSLVSSPSTFLDSQGLQISVPSLPGGTAVASVLNPDGNVSESIPLQSGSAAPSIFGHGVAEGAGFQALPYPISAGSIVSVFGTFPGVTEQQAQSFPLPTTLGDARVSLNGVSVPLLFSSSGQVNFVAPSLLSQPSVRVTVSVKGQTSAVETPNVAPTAPGIFAITADGAGAFLHGARQTDVVTKLDPATRGEIVVLYLTGMGNGKPRQFDGEPVSADFLTQTDAQPIVTIGGVAARVLFSGLASGYSGLYQINLEVPLSAPTGDGMAVTVTSDSRTSNMVRLAVR